MIILYVFIVLLAIILIFSAITYKIVFRKSKKDNNIYNIPEGKDYQQKKDMFINLIDNFNKISYEDVYIKSHDELNLHARYYHIKDSAPLNICFHGYRATSTRDFCGGIKMCFDNGHNVLLIDERAHGKSDGKAITFGIKERYDCLDWINYAINRFPSSKILLYGISMGAATILMASNLITSNNVVGIIADCPYSSPSKIIKKVCKDMKLPPNLVFPFIYLGGLIYGRFNLNESSAIESVKDCKIPILIMHGKNDSFVPSEMSKEIKTNATSDLKLVLFPNAEHGLSYIVDENKYRKNVQDFLKKVLN